MIRPTIYLTLSDVIEDLAPPPPPCFLNRRAWHEYLKSSAASQNDRKPNRHVIICKDGKPAINYDYPYCKDCTQAHSLQMTKEGRCKPDFLKQQGAHQP